MTMATGVHALSASTLMKEPVRNRQGEDIGKIEDYMIDLKSGCVDYAVLSFGGFLGIGDKMFAIPWQRMQLDTENHEWVLDVTREQLENAPGFEKNNWPGTGDDTYERSAYDYWGVDYGSRATRTGGYGAGTGTGTTGGSTGY